MDKRTFIINNPTSEYIRITELSLSIPPGISNLFTLNPNINYEQIDYSMRNGTLRAAMDNEFCHFVPDISKSYSSDVLIKPSSNIQILPSRARFSVIQNVEASVFDSEEDAALFNYDDVKPARQLEEEIKKSTDNIQNITATIKDANLEEKPIENRYSLQPKPPEILQQKVKNDMMMRYETCNGKTAGGKRCLRQAKTNSKFCGLHKNQEV